MRNGISGWVLGVATTTVMALPLAGGAQVADSSQYVVAQQMVANGDAVRGRRLVDSLLKAAPTGSAQYAEGLYWRATIGTNARDSEHDYRQIVVDYPLSSRVPDALLRMGELEAQRGDREAALQHFQRLTIEHPDSPLRAEANYWIARTYLERNDTAHGCAANANALAQVSASNIELKNRIDYQQQACRGVAVAAVPQNAPVTVPPVTRAESTIAREVPVTTAPVARTESTVVEKPAAKAAEKPAVKAPARVATKPSPRAAAESSARARAAKRAAAESTTARRSASASAAASSSAKGGYAVQVAAYSTRAQGEALVAKLRGRGYDARVDGTQAPYRVRIGHYATHAAAAAELAKLKAKQMDGFVTEP